MANSNSISNENQNNSCDQDNDKKNEVVSDQRTKAHQRARVVFDHIRSKAERSGPFSLKPNRTVDHERDIMTSKESKKSNDSDNEPKSPSNNSSSPSPPSSIDQKIPEDKPSPKL